MEQALCSIDARDHLKWAVPHSQHIGINSFVVASPLLVKLTQYELKAGNIGIDRRLLIFIHYSVIKVLALAAKLLANSGQRLDNDDRIRARIVYQRTMLAYQGHKCIMTIARGYQCFVDLVLMREM